MADQTRKGEQFRRLHLPGKPLILFNIWDAGSAKVAATGGAKALRRAVGRSPMQMVSVMANASRSPLQSTICAGLSARQSFP